MTQHAGFGSDGFRFAAQIHALPGAAPPSTDREALADLVMAATLYLERRDPEGKALARRRLQDAIATSLAVLDSLQPDPPAVVCEPVIICTPVERSSAAEVLPGGVVGEGSPVAVRDDNVPPAGPPGDSPPDEDLAGEPSAPDEMQPGGQRQPWEAGTHGPATCAVLEDDPPRPARDGSATGDIAPRADARTNTPPPGLPPLTADVPGGAQHAGSAGPCERCGNGNLCECDMDAAWNLACLHIARKIEDSSPPWDETVRRCARIARGCRKADDVGEAGVPRRDAPVTTQAGSLDSGLRGAGCGAPAWWDGVELAGYTGMQPCSRCGVVVVWYDETPVVCNDSARVDLAEVPDVTRPLALPRDPHAETTCPCCETCDRPGGQILYALVLGSEKERGTCIWCYRFHPALAAAALDALGVR